ncbi:MAG: serine hydrolase domain-containing protein [Candidatus Limnocylindria bacterium]
MLEPRHFSLRRALGLSLLAAITTQVSFAPAAASAAEPPAMASVNEAVAAELGAAVSRARKYSIAPGLSASVVTADGRQWAGASGKKRSGSWLKPDAALTIGSVTKTFTAAIVMGLVDEGRIALDAPVNRYLPNVRLARGVTVRQLLNHTSGIADLYGPTRTRLQGAPNRAMSSNDVLGSIPGRKFKAGRGYGYSNTNYYLLGHIIEAVTQRSFNEELAARFGSRLGFQQTRLLTAADTQLPAAWSTAFWTSGAMVSTPTELARWGQALYGGGLLSIKGRARMMDFHNGNRYALGSQLLKIGGRDLPGHSGLLYTTTSLLIYLPAERATVAIMATAPQTDLEAALTTRYGGPSIMDVVHRLAG